MKIFNYYHQADKKSGPPGMEIRLFCRERRAEGTGQRAQGREQRAEGLSALRSPP